jgi:transcriptional regulator with GAF, ATPase, and Fis domain
MVFEAMAAHHSGPLSVKVFERWVMERGGLETGVKACASPTVPQTTSAAMVFPPVLPTLREIQSQLIDEALRRSNDNQAVAAKMLGVTRQALNRRLLNPVE